MSCWCFLSILGIHEVLVGAHGTEKVGSRPPIDMPEGGGPCSIPSRCVTNFCGSGVAGFVFSGGWFCPVGVIGFVRPVKSAVLSSVLVLFRGICVKKNKGDYPQDSQTQGSTTAHPGRKWANHCGAVGAL